MTVICVLPDTRSRRQRSTIYQHPSNQFTTTQAPSNTHAATPAACTLIMYSGTHQPTHSPAQPLNKPTTTSTYFTACALRLLASLLDRAASEAAACPEECIPYPEALSIVFGVAQVVAVLVVCVVKRNLCTERQALQGAQISTAWHGTGQRGAGHDQKVRQQLLLLGVHD